MRRIVLWGVGIVAAILLAAGAALALLDLNSLRGPAGTLAGAITGREVRIGRLAGGLGWTTRITLSRVTIGNPDWLEDAAMAEMRSVRVSFRPLSLLFGPADVPELVIDDARLDLVRRKDGKANWQFPAAAEVAGEAAMPEARGEFPRIGRFEISGLVVTLDDALGQQRQTFTIDSAAAAANESDEVRLKAGGRKGKQALRLDFRGVGFERLVASDAPYPAEVRLVMGEVEIGAKGTVAEPMNFSGARLKITARGPSLAALLPLVPAALPESPPFDLSGDLSYGGSAVRVENLRGRLGESDLAGWISYRAGEPRPRLEGELRSKRLDVDVLAGLVGLSPGAAPKTDGGRRQARQGEARLFPDTPIRVRRLHLADMDVSLVAQSVASKALPIDGVELRFRLDDGRLLVRPFELGVAAGRISGEAALNGRQEVPSADLDVSFQNLDLRPFFKGTRFVQETSGRFFGRLKVLGVGHSLDEMAATARGEGRLAMRGGKISGLLVEAAGIDIAEALMLVVKDVPVTIRCAIVPQLKIEDGKVMMEQAAVDTTDSTLYANGFVDLGREILEIRIRASAKDFSFLDLSATVTVSGQLTAPSFSVGDLRPFPFFELGEQEDLDCGRLLKGGSEPLAEAVREEAGRSR